MDVRMELSRILITELGDEQVIFLKEKDGPRTFPILIGINEALAIDRRIKGVTPPRPMTHDLLAGVIRAMGGVLEKIVIRDLKEHTFFAALHIRTDGKVVEIDSRPSDAIALGAAMDTPIYVASRVLDEVLKAPSSKEDRLQILRDRAEVLRERIDELSQRLDDPDFVAHAPDELVQQARTQLDQMQTERSAIERVLKKLG